MDFLTSLAFCGALTIFAATPGPGTFAVIARGLGSGFKHGLFMGFGMVLGDLIFLLIAIYGLSSVAIILGDLFVFLKYIGGAYLVYLGYKIFKSKTFHSPLNSSKSISYKSDFTSGLFICLGNPKVIFFYLGFLPTFIDLTSLTNNDIILIVILVIIVLNIVLGSYAYFASKAKKAIKKPKTQKIMNNIASFLMISVGLALIFNS